MMRVKNHHMIAMVLVEIVLEGDFRQIRSWETSCCYLGRMSQPWQRKEPIPNQSALEMVHWLVASPSPLSSHSYGVILARRNMEMDTPR